MKSKIGRLFSQLFKPNLYYQNILDIKLEQLNELKIQGLICDLDNTLLAWEQEKIDLEIKHWLSEIQAADISICILSNALRRRANEATQDLNLPVISEAFKPHKKNFELAIKKLGVNTEQIAVIGDQLFTDILGANRLHLLSILVEPLSSKDFIGTRLIRLFEKKIIKYMDLE